MPESQPSSLSRSAESVQKALSQAGLKCQVVELSSSTRTAAEAAETIGCTVAQIVKTLIFKTKDSHRPILVLASGPTRVNEKAIEAHLGEQLIKADADFTREVTGFAIGGIPPIGHKQAIQAFVDEDLLPLGELWAAAGTPNAVFRLNATDLVQLTGGQVICIQ